MKYLGLIALTLGPVTMLTGCSSPPSTDQLALRARTTVEHQESEAMTLIRALASAQRKAAEASWDSIFNAAAQNFRTGKGMPLDSPLSDEDHSRVLETAHKNLQQVIDHISKMEANLLEAIAFDYERRSRFLQNLIEAVSDEDARSKALEALERLDDARRRADIDVIDHSFKKAIERQIGYVG